MSARKFRPSLRQARRRIRMHVRGAGATATLAHETAHVFAARLAGRAGEIRIPVLAAWGVDDQRVPVEQGRRFRAAAAKAGVDLEYVEYAGEGHNWLKPETSIDFFGRVEKLLAKTIDGK